MAFTFCDQKAIRRSMARTPTKPVQVTRNGTIYDHVHYRWNREGIEEMLDVGDRRLPASLRKPGTAAVHLFPRVWDDDIDMIEVFDPDSGYHELYSTEPEYTSDLSRWEHHEYLDMIKAGKGGAISEGGRLLIKGRSLVEADAEMPRMPFRDRAAPSALIDAEGFRRASGHRARREGFADVPELGISMTAGGAGRVDQPTAPPQPDMRKKGGTSGKYGKRGRTDPARRAPERDADYGFASVPRVRKDDAAETTGRGEPAADIAAERSARWRRLAEEIADADADAPVDESAGAGGSGPEGSRTPEYHLRDDDAADADDGMDDAVAYDDPEGEDEE